MRQSHSKLWPLPFGGWFIFLFWAQESRGYSIVLEVKLLLPLPLTEPAHPPGSCGLGRGASLWRPPNLSDTKVKFRYIHRETGLHPHLLLCLTSGPCEPLSPYNRQRALSTLWLEYSSLKSCSCLFLLHCLSDYVFLRMSIMQLENYKHISRFQVSYLEPSLLLSGMLPLPKILFIFFPLEALCDSPDWVSLTFPSSLCILLYHYLSTCITFYCNCGFIGSYFFF